MSATMPTSPEPSHPAIDEALHAALFYLHATNIPDALTLARIFAARTVRLLDSARAGIEQKGASHE